MSNQIKSHGQRAHEVRVGVSESEHIISQTNNRECLIPIDDKITLCSQPTDYSHSIQRALMRDCLSRSDNKMVLNFMPRATALVDFLYEQFKKTNPTLPIEMVAASDNTEYWRPHEISVTDASANPFACGSDYNNHDKEIFKPIEDYSVDFNSLEHLFLFAYRCVLYALEELYNARNFYADDASRRMIPKYNSQSRRESRWLEKHRKQLRAIEQETMSFQKAIPRLDNFKSLLDTMLIEENYSNLEHKVVDFSAPISMAASTFDTEGGAMITVYPTNDTGDHKVIISWHKEEMNPRLERSVSAIIQSIVSPNDEVESFLERILGGSYNVYTSTDYYRKIPEDMQEHIREARKQNCYDNIHVFIKAMGELATIREQELANRKWLSRR